MNRSGPILVTGCSSGIGKATCERLVRSGRVVYASARRIDSLAELATLGCRTVELDVTDEITMARAVASIETEHGYVDTLVNNAGYGVYGPIEQVSLQDVRVEFETNLFGLTRLTQLVLPAMRAHGSGRIINVSSVAGRATFPGGAFYQASKFALESLSDSLRLELAPFGIKVAVVEPGPIRTGWAERAAKSIPLDEGADDEDPYAGYKIAVTAMLLGRERGVAKFVQRSPDDVARVIQRAVEAPRPRSRYPVGVAATFLIQARKFMPDAAYDALLTKMFRLDQY